MAMLAAQGAPLTSVGVIDAMEKDEERALAALYRSHVEFVHRVVRQLGVEDADVEDVIQDVFVVAVRRFREFRGEAEVRTWLYAIAAHQVRNYRRSTRRRLRRLLAWRHHEDVESRVAAPPNGAHSDVSKLLARLDEASRALVILVDLHGMSVVEVAEALGLNPNTAYARLRRARNKLTAWTATEPNHDR